MGNITFDGVTTYSGIRKVLCIDTTKSFRKKNHRIITAVAEIIL